MKRIIVLLLLSMLFQRAFPQWNANTMLNTPVAKSTLPEYVFGEATGDGNGGSIIPMVADAGNGNYHIYAQRMSADGEALWGDSLHPAAVALTPSYKSELCVVSDENGGGIFAWGSYNATFDTIRVYLQHINASGLATWQTNGIQLPGAYKENRNIRMCGDGNGGVYISWTSDNRSSNMQVYAQHISATGQITWGNNGILLCNAPGFRAIQGIVKSGAGAIVVFTDSRNDPNGIDYTNFYNNASVNLDLYAQKINEQGLLQWPDTAIVVCNQPGNQYRPFPLDMNIVTDGSNGAIIVFHDRRRDPATDIYAQRISSNGSTLWADTAALVRRQHNNESLDLNSICADSAGGVAVTWNVYNFLNSATSGTHCQRLNGNGVKMWPTDGIMLASGGLNPAFSTIAKDDEGNYIISGTNVGDIDFVNAHKLDGVTGAKLWGNGVIISNNNPRTEESNLVKSSGNSFIISWCDDRNNQTDIYSAKILSNGNLAITVSNKYISNANGNWNNPASWAGNIVPPATADIIIKHNIVVTENTTCRSLKTEGPGAAVSVNTGSNLTVQNP